MSWASALPYDRWIYDEWCVGVIEQRSREAGHRIIAGLVSRGAQGIILGCTETGPLVGDGDARVPLFDTSGLHARAAAMDAG